jgi:hypothetical protein
MEYKITYQVTTPQTDVEEIQTKTIFAENEYEALFQLGYRLRGYTDGNPVKLVAVTRYPVPEQVYFKADTRTSEQAEIAFKTGLNALYGYKGGAFEYDVVSKYPEGPQNDL